MTSKELRKKYIEFFKKKGHVEIPSASLVPENDPSVLFTTAGMHPLVPFLLGEKHPSGKRLVNSQKCIRTGDIDEVGNKTHHTFLEMLGHWSLGDYWKKDALEMSYEFLTQGLGLDKDRLGFSVYKCGKNIPTGFDEEKFDKEAFDIWKNLGVPEKRIQFLEKENWWEQKNAVSGPCGPCTEYFYWTDNSTPVPEKFDPEDKRWVEIGNDVLMEYEKSEFVILVDAVHCLIDIKNGINLKLLNELNKLNNRKIVATNATLDKLKEFEPDIEKYNLEIFSLLKKPEKTEPKYFKKLLKDKNLKPEQVIYFDHSQDNLDSAQKTGINKTFLYTQVNPKLKDFLDNNLFGYISAKQKNIDNGTGLERLLAVINGLDDNYLTDLFKPIIKKIEELSGKKYNTSPQSSPYKGEEVNRSMRIIADHLRAATFIMGDDLGIAPSNVDQGYVVRKLIRRAIRHGKLLGINDLFCFKITEVVIKIMKDVYPELKKNKDFIIEQMVQEEEKFRKTINEGLKRAEKILIEKKPLNRERFVKIVQSKDKNEIFRKLYRNNKAKGFLGVKNEEILSATLNGKEAFDLYQTYGFPIEMIVDLVQAKNMFVDIESFEEELKKHQELSRTASAGKFKGGLADQSEQVIKYHTATHLLQAALRQVLGKQVQQKGSNITEKRLRFDFSYDKKMTEGEIKQVEDMVNNYIQQDIPVKCEEISLEEAKKRGAIGLFADKYGDKVKVYTICLDMAKPISCEICGGPHVDNTGQLGKFRIIKETSSSAGVRRIKAVLE